jgi:sortase A
MDEIAVAEPDAEPTPKRSVGVRIVRGIAWVSLTLGLLILGFVVQQLFVTSWFAERNQEALEEEAREHFSSAQVTAVPLSEVPGFDDPDADPGTDPGPLLLVETAPAEHEAFAIIRIPSIEGLEEGWTVVSGIGRNDLRNGAGHMPHTPLPGQPGNAVISGHRTTYGAPFHDLDTLAEGDRVEVETAIGVHVYEVRESLVVAPTDIWVTRPREGAWLTLTTCNPKFSSRERLIVFAELVEGPNAAAILSA